MERKSYNQEVKRQTGQKTLVNIIKIQSSMNLHRIKINMQPKWATEWFLEIERELDVQENERKTQWPMTLEQLIYHGMMQHNWNSTGSRWKAVLPDVHKPIYDCCCHPTNSINALETSNMHYIDYNMQGRRSHGAKAAVAHTKFRPMAPR